MRKILFTCGNMSIGGVQKSLISLLKSINYNENTVYLMLNSISGELLEQLPEKVQLLKAPEILYLPTFNKARITQDFKYLLRHPQHFSTYYKSLKLIPRYGSKRAKEEFWTLTNSNKPILYENEIFDVAISYAGGIGIWNNFIINSVHSKKKVCWYHGDYNKIGSKSKKEKENLISFDSIVAVSETVKNSLIEHIPKLKENIYIIPNIIDRELIVEQAKISIPYHYDSSVINFVSVSRLDKEKGFDEALQAFSKAKKENINFKWLIVGDGNERRNLERQIRRLELNDLVEIIGFKSNPYPYIKNADVFLHPSKSEGFGLVVAEAKLLTKPILITNYPSVSEQIKNGKNGIVVPINVEGIFKGIKEICSNEELRNRLAHNLEGFTIDNASIFKFEKLLKL